MHIPLLSDMASAVVEIAGAVSGGLQTNATLAIVECPCGCIWSVLYPNDYLTKRVHVPECPGCGGSGRRFATVTRQVFADGVQ
jgi:hypothetical protein